MSFWNRLWFTLAALVVYRIGTYLPLPGLDPAHALSSRPFSIFAFGIAPYLSASFFMLVLTAFLPPLRALRGQGEVGAATLDRYGRWLAVLFAAMQAYGLSARLEGLPINAGVVASESGVLFRITVTASLIGGTVLVMCLADQITAKGIGNGILLIIGADYVASTPSSLAALIEFGRTRALAAGFIIATIGMLVAIVAFVVYMERAQRRVPVLLPARDIGGTVVNGGPAALTLKLNLAGIIPPIFATQVLLLPATIASFEAGSGRIIDYAAAWISHGRPAYIVFYMLLIIVFAYLYTAFVSSPAAMAESPRRYAGFVPGVAPGKNTADFLDGVLTRLTLIGALYLACICALPEILISRYYFPFYFGGSRLLIIVCVALDTIKQIQAHFRDPS